MMGATEIAEAFVEDDMQAAAPVESGLLAAVPAPAEAEFEKLEEISSRHRVLLVRAGAVIAITTLISVGGALLLHALVAGVIVMGIWFPWLPGHGPVRRGEAVPGVADVGGSPGGFTILGNGPDDNAPPAPVAPSVLGMPAAGLASVLPALPETLTTPAVATIVPVVPTTPTLPPDMTGAQMQPPQVAAPPVVSAAVNPLTATAGAADANAATLNPGMPARGTGVGDGGGDEERIFSTVKGDGGSGAGGGGVGTGRGMGRGSGINRGLSAADREPQLLGYSANSRNFTLPMKYQIQPPDQSVRLILAIAPDGSIAAAKLDQSCGIGEVDELVRDYVLANFHFSPAYRAGKAVAAEFPFEMSFKPFD